MIKFLKITKHSSSSLDEIAQIASFFSSLTYGDKFFLHFNRKRINCCSHQNMCKGHERTFIKSNNIFVTYKLIGYDSELTLTYNLLFLSAIAGLSKRKRKKQKIDFYGSLKKMLKQC